MTTLAHTPHSHSTSQFSMTNHLRPGAYYLTQYICICCPQDTHTFWDCGVGDVAYLKFMHRFFTYRVASSVSRCVGVVGGSGSMGNNGRRHSMAASCFQLVLCVNECLSLSPSLSLCLCLCVSVCG